MVGFGVSVAAGFVSLAEFGVLGGVVFFGVSGLDNGSIPGITTVGAFGVTVGLGTCLIPGITTVSGLFNKSNVPYSTVRFGAVVVVAFLGAGFCTSR